jgi:hypothetical protein
LGPALSCMLEVCDIRVLGPPAILCMQSTMFHNSGSTITFAKIATSMLAILCVVQQTLIGVSTLVVAFFPLSHHGGAIPWSGLVVKTIAAITLVAVSFHLCRWTVRALLRDQSSNRVKTAIGIAWLLFGVAFTVKAYTYLLVIAVFSHGDTPGEPAYWEPVMAAGGSLLVFSILCWLWWLVARALS